MTGGLSTFVAVLFGLAILGALVTTILSIRSRATRERRDDRPAGPKESAEHTWRTAVPWIGCFGLLVVVLLVAYALTR